MPKTISTQPTRANIASVMALLEDTPTKLEQLSQPLSSGQLCQPLAEGKRSFSEDLAHLINCEARVSEAIYLALLTDQPLLVEVHPERDWGKLLAMDLLEFPDLLAYFKLRRRVLLRVLGELTDLDWARTVREKGKKRQESVYWKARALALHELHHLEILEDRLHGLR